jgi:deazaflavin-dependent oxidoreductase (nitroreductase family)
VEKDSLMIDPSIEQALRNDRVVDITTLGRKSGEARRIEIWLHYAGDGIAYLTGQPGRRHWYANLLETPEFTVHVKRGAQADLAAVAAPILDPDERRAVLTQIYGADEARLEQRIAESPLMRVELTRDS